MRLLMLAILVVIGGLVMVASGTEDRYQINGASLVNPPRPISMEALGPVKRTNAEWVALIPYAFSRSGEPKVTFDHSRQWWGEHTDGNCQLIQFAKDQGLKVMVKPHVWSMGDGWVGDFDLGTESEWKVWEKDYTAYILNHAVKADSMNVEMLCIGTEYRIPSRERPAFWRSLIRQVREVYKGKITYAANWDNFDQITWWDAVDYIGIDAYFPLVEGDHPSVDAIEKAWTPIKNDLSAHSRKWNKPILFTEYGFQSANGAAGPHWDVDKSETNVNLQLQADAYEATFRALQDESWWMGGFFWKWHIVTRGDRWRGTEWTPQNKPAEQVIAKWYGKNN